MEPRDADMGISREKIEAAPPTRSPQQPAGTGSWNLLALARQLVQQGQPSHALQAVLMAMRSEGGEQAVLHTLNRARDLYRNKIHANTTADELASLFAQCVIDEAQPLGLNPSLQLQNPVGYIISPDPSDTSILAKSGRKQVMLDAFADGSSFICLKCGGLVSNHRKDEHLMYWCS